jgi:hypothetical protein
VNQIEVIVISIDKLKKREKSSCDESKEYKIKHRRGMKYRR